MGTGSRPVYPERIATPDELNDLFAADLLESGQLAFWPDAESDQSTAHDVPMPAPPRDFSPRGVGRKLKQLLREEFEGVNLRLMIARTVLSVLPNYSGGRIRAFVLRLIGFQIGRGTIIAGTPNITFDADVYGSLTIGTGCWININCLMDLGAGLKIGNNVSIGHDAMLLTRSHEIGPAQQRASTQFAKPVTIGNGVWLGARTTVLPGVTIGAGAIVAAGSVVSQNVRPNTLVAGVPARTIRTLR